MPATIEEKLERIAKAIGCEKIEITIAPTGIHARAGGKEFCAQKFDSLANIMAQSVLQEAETKLITVKNTLDWVSQSKKQTPEETKSKCTIPPEGWYCTRNVGHEGPCAALPAGPNNV